LKELDFFLKGNTSIEKPKNENRFEWISDAGFKDLNMLISLGDKWRNLITDIEKKENDWRKWYELIQPENEVLPTPYHTLSKFEILLLLRIFRPDRVVNGIKKYIIE
jgi:dynein heavy chain